MNEKGSIQIKGSEQMKYKQRAKKKKILYISEREIITVRKTEKRENEKNKVKGVRKMKED